MKVIKYKVNPVEGYIKELIPKILETINNYSSQYIAIDLDRDIYIFETRPTNTSASMWESEEGVDCAFIGKLPLKFNFTWKESIWKLEGE